MVVCDESKPYIFISYSHRDSDKVLKIMDRLKSAGYNVWYDGGIDPGTEWDENIAKHVQGCAYFIAFVSANYIASKNCKDELNYSRDLDKEQLLVYLEDVELPGGMAMRMNRIQAIWWNKYSNVEEAYEKLFSAKGIDRAKLGGEGAQPVSTGGGASGSASKSESETFKEKTSAGNKDKKPFIIGGIAAAVLAVVALIAVLVSGGGKKYMEQGIAAYNSKYHGTEDNAAARAAFEKAAQKGEADAYYYLGRIDELEYKYSDARDHYNKGIEAGSDLSKAGLAYLYISGLGGAYDREGARKLAEEAYGAGCKEAAYCMGWLTRDGLAGITKDAEKALDYYKEAAETGDQKIASDACWSIGSLYKNGTGSIEQDYTEAISWYKKIEEISPYHEGDSYELVAQVYKAQDEGLKADENYKKAYAAFLAAAEQGDIYSMCYVGVYLKSAYGVEEDYPAAIEWYKKAAEGGNYAAMRNLASNYLNNENNPKKAEEYYQMAVDAGDITSMDKMGDLYYDGKLNDGNPDYKLARQWYEKAADLGYSDAMYSLGKMYYDGKETGTADYKTARQWYEKAVDAGSSGAMNNMGYGYERGGFSEDGQPDYAKAVEWYELAAENGNSTAMNNLGNLYRSEGNGITDYAKAEEWYLKGAAEGNNSSMNSLGNMYSNEKYGMVDIEKAAKYYTDAANAGYSYAWVSLGLLYEKKDNGITDYNKALECYEKAAAAGQKTAYYYAGLLYDNGSITTDGQKDYAKAQEWYQKGIDAGNTDSMVAMGNLYRYGQLGTKDPQKAKEYYELAADKYSYAAKYLGDIYYAKELGSYDFEKAKQYYLKAIELGYKNANASPNLYLNLGKIYYYTKMYEIDLGPSDPKAAEPYFKTAAEAGNAEAQWFLGQIIEFGMGATGKPDPAEAAKWYEKAADGKNSSGAYSLGSIYFYGKLGSVDYKKALEWYGKAAESGNVTAKEAIQKMVDAGQISKVEAAPYLD